MHGAVGNPTASTTRAYDTPDDTGGVSGEAGFAGCWTKPVELQQVLNELNRRSGGTAAR